MNHESPPATSSLFPYWVKSDAFDRKGVVVHKAPSTASNGLTERSVFHEPWWLDIATGGEWDVAVVKSGGELIGEMPYAMSRRGIWRVSTLPPLTRSLGPVVKPIQGASGQDWRHRLSISNELISQLPSCARVHQILDPRITEALAFSVQGFAVSATYTLQITRNSTEVDVWAGMRPNTRNIIRRAAENMIVMEIRNANEFADFYELNLEHRKQKNIYGRVMRQLVNEFVRRKAGLLLGAYGDDGLLSAAIALVWDSTTIYYLLSTRSERTHGGSISLLLWTGIRVALEQNMVFDFDGIGSPGILRFLSGFGGTLVQRYEVERLRADYAALRALRRAAKAVSSGTYRTWRWPLGTSA
jgi:hypothetical protein